MLLNIHGAQRSVNLFLEFSGKNLCQRAFSILNFYLCFVCLCVSLFFFASYYLPLVWIKYFVKETVLFNSLKNTNINSYTLLEIFLCQFLASNRAKMEMRRVRKLDVIEKNWSYFRIQPAKPLKNLLKYSRHQTKRFFCCPML